MAKNLLGIDIGHDRLKLVLVNGKQIKKSAIVSMPQNLIRNGSIVSTEALGELIRSTMKENKISCKNAALVLSDEGVFVRNVTMPVMSADQLVYNLPYEFRDYISDELKNYVFDYAMISTPEEMSGPAQELYEEEGTPVSRTMDLLAVAAPVSLIQESKEMIRKAGLKLVKAAPSVCCYTSLIREMEKNTNVYGKEYCILDLGYQSIHMHIFRGDCHMVTRVLEIGLSSLDQAIADTYHVDIHLAHTYLLTNHDDCQNKSMCTHVFDRIAIELMRALNFYSFNNMDSQLEDIWISGGGVAISSLGKAIANQLNMNIHKAEELLPNQEAHEEPYSLIQAYGITQD